MTKEQVTQSDFLELINKEIKNNPTKIEGLAVKEIKPSLKNSYVLTTNPTADIEARERIVNDAIATVSSRYEPA